MGERAGLERLRRPLDRTARRERPRARSWPAPICYLLPVALALHACATPDARDVSPPPTAGVLLSASPAVAGTSWRVTASGLDPGERALLVRGDRSASWPRCAPQLSRLCVDVERPEIWTSAVVDGAGEVQFSTTPPASMSGTSHVLQVVSRSGVGFKTSNVIMVDVLDPDADADRDGLSNLRELQLGANVFDADSDDGGTADGQEVDVDGTDPLSAGDDVPGERACENGVDDDGDGRLDCADDECVQPCAEVACADGIDNDGNGVSDCADPDCQQTFVCGESSCGNGIDDDSDGLVDCEDIDCLGSPACVELDCADNSDNDGDGLTDCDDDDCWSPACHGSALSWIDHAAPVEFMIKYAYWPGFPQSSPTGSHILRYISQYNVGLGPVAGAVLVAEPGELNPRVCDFTVIDPTLYWSGSRGWVERPWVNVDPRCQLRHDFLPDEFTFDFFRGWAVSNETWYGTLRHVRDRYATMTIGPTNAFGFCETVAPIAMGRDRDHDGFARGPQRDHAGRTAHGGWACTGNEPGVSDDYGDCMDDVPDWTPRDVTLALTASCSTVRPSDWDGDGTPRNEDPDDLNGGTP